jgi:hypothetical protein
MKKLGRETNIAYPLLSLGRPNSPSSRPPQATLPFVSEYFTISHERVGDVRPLPNLSESRVRTCHTIYAVFARHVNMCKEVVEFITGTRRGIWSASLHGWLDLTRTRIDMVGKGAARLGSLQGVEEYARLGNGRFDETNEAWLETRRVILPRSVPINHSRRDLNGHPDHRYT